MERLQPFFMGAWLLHYLDKNGLYRLPDNRW